MNDIITVLLADNDVKQVKEAVESIWKYYQTMKITILYHQSSCGVKEWCDERNIPNVCYEEAKDFSYVLKMVIKDTHLKDIFIMSSEIRCLPSCMERLQKVLDEQKDIGAVIPKFVTSDIIAGRKYFKDLSEYAQKQRNGKKRQILDIGYRAVLISHRLLQGIELEEKLILPIDILIDIVIQGVNSGYHFYEVENALVEESVKEKLLCENKNAENTDFHFLSEKWNMKYMLKKPNTLLIGLIQCEKESFSVLEVGCTIGTNLLEIGNLYPKAQLYGVEINPSAAKMASAFADVREGNIEDKNLNFKDVLFDYIIFGDVLEHLHDPKGVLEYCKSILAEGGKIIASIPNLMHWSVMKPLINGFFTYGDFGLLDRTHIHFFTYYEMVQMFTEAGYHVTNVKVTDGEGASDEIKEFVNQLMDISENAAEFMFWTYQYYVVAEKV